MHVHVPLEVDVPAPVININLAPGTPLMCDGEQAAKLFGVSKRALESLRKHNPDFPVRHIGTAVRYLVPDLYAWLRDYPDRRIPLE